MRERRLSKLRKLKEPYILCPSAKEQRKSKLDIKPSKRDKGLTNDHERQINWNDVHVLKGKQRDADNKTGERLRGRVQKGNANIRNKDWLVERRIDGIAEGIVTVHILQEIWSNQERNLKGSIVPQSFKTRKRRQTIAAAQWVLQPKKLLRYL